jgi:hypothetical protein
VVEGICDALDFGVVETGYSLSLNFCQFFLHFMGDSTVVAGRKMVVRFVVDGPLDLIKKVLIKGLVYGGAGGIPLGGDDTKLLCTAVSFFDLSNSRL